MKQGKKVKFLGNKSNSDLRGNKEIDNRIAKPKVMLIELYRIVVGTSQLSR